MSRLPLRVLALSAVLAAASAACRDAVSDCKADTDYFKDKPKFEDAKAITKLDFKNTYVDVEVTSPNAVFGETTVLKSRLVRCGCEDVAPKAGDGVTQVSIPPKGVYVDDSIMMAMLTSEIDALDFVKASVGAKSFYSDEVQAAAKRGDFKAIEMPPGSFEPASLEIAGMEDKVDVALLNDFSYAKYSAALAAGNLSTPYLVISETAEKTPLGRAEWVKYLGLITGRVSKANDEYGSIKLRYNAIKRKAGSVRRRPSVFLNYPSTDEKNVTTWSAPGGEQYITTFVRDANADYRLGTDGKKVTASQSLEEVEKNFASARYWINMASFPATNSQTLDALVSDKKVPKEYKDTFKKLAAVKCGHTWSQAKRLKNNGATNDFFEMAVVRPEKVLEDLLTIFHPQVAEKKPEDLTFYYSLGKAGDGVGGECPYNELPLDAPAGKTYSRTDLKLSGVDRFTVEDKLAEGKLRPAIASQYDAVKENDVEVFFDQPVDDNKNDTFASVRLQVDDDAKIDDGKIVSAFEKSFPDTTAKVIKTETSDSSAAKDGDGGLTGGAIAGIVLGSLAVLLAVILGVFFIVKKRSSGDAAGMQVGGDAKAADDAAKNSLAEQAPGVAEAPAEVV